MPPDQPRRRADDPERKLRRLEKRLTRSEMRREELEHLMDGSQAFQRRVLEDVERQKAEIERLYASLEREQERTTQLLHSIMPEAVAEELKAKGKVQPRRLPGATVLFADFVGFTSSTEKLDPVELVGMLDHYYSAFDQIISRHGVEKVKTIGDAYMCMAGDEEESSDHAQRACNAALGILEFVARSSAGDAPHSVQAWDVRIGMNSGPVSTGVVGEDRLSYDVWGDTVNTAARVVSACGVNQIYLSGTTRGLVEGTHATEDMGAVEAKGKGRVAVFRLTG